MVQMMKKTIALLLILVAGLAMAADDKIIDTQDHVMDSPGRIQITGTLDENSPTWDRGYGFDDPSLDCMFELTPAYFTGQFYDMICITTTDNEPIEIVVDPDATTLHDTTLHIFCEAFDPAQPLVNCLYFDDDGGDGLYSAIILDFLPPGHDFWLILSNYGSGDPDDIGDYVINTSDNVELCGGVAVEGKTWSAVKGLFE